MTVVAETPLVPAEIRRTRLYGLLLFPLLVAWPLPLAIFGMSRIDHGELWGLVPLCSLVWIIGVPMRLLSWHEARFRPNGAPDRPAANQR